MLSTLLIVLVTLFLCAYVAVPLLWPGQADPLPDFRDPVTQDLEEERDALFRAIRELDVREDLPEARRAELRARYEAKAAKVLRALDEREAALAGRPVVTPAPARARRAPVAALSLLGLMGVSALLLGGYVLPRVGEQATVTTADAGQLAAARSLQTLQRAADRDPSADNLLALADAYWQAGEADGAKTVYERITNEITPAPALAYRRLGFLALQDDLNVALAYLQKAKDADPNDLDTLFALGEVYFALDRTDEAVDSWNAFLAAPGGAGNAEVEARLETAQAVAPLVAAVNNDPSEANLAALGDFYWSLEDRERAANAYFRVLTEANPENPVALSRVGQVLFFSGRTDDAVAVLERARGADDTDLQTLLFLGNGYFTLGAYEQAIGAWERYVEVAGGPTAAGRVPSLIEDARARLAGGTTGGTSTSDAPANAAPSAVAPNESNETVMTVSGEGVYAARCAGCHGAAGGGGAGPKLVGNARAADTDRLTRVIQNGRGMMPAFGSVLTKAELEAVVQYVSGTLSQGEPSQASRP